MAAPKLMGHHAHKFGQLLAQCPFAKQGVKRRLWRAGWMERERYTVAEETLRRVARLSE